MTLVVCLAEDIILRYCPTHVGVPAGITVIAENKVFAIRNSLFWQGTAGYCTDMGLSQRRAIYVNNARPDRNFLSRQSNYAFDKRCIFWIVRIF